MSEQKRFSPLSELTCSVAISHPPTKKFKLVVFNLIEIIDFNMPYIIYFVFNSILHIVTPPPSPPKKWKITFKPGI